MKYESRVTQVEAWIWDGEDHAETYWVSKFAEPDAGADGELWVEKSNNWCDLRKGDYIVAEPDGSGFYPCTAEVFRARYYPVCRHGKDASVWQFCCDYKP